MELDPLFLAELAAFQDSLRQLGTALSEWLGQPIPPTLDTGSPETDFAACTDLLRQLAGMCGTAPRRVEEAVQNVWLAIAERLPDLPGEGSPARLGAWL